MHCHSFSCKRPRWEQLPLRILRGNAAKEHGKLFRVSRLQENGARAGELADETLSRRKARDETTRSYTLQNVAGIPCHKVAIVHDVLFACGKL